MSDVNEKKDTVKKCPSCGQTLGSFQTKCPSCGHEISTAAAAESVQGFFQKLEELSEREYQANKEREGKAKQKKKSPWPLRICEAVAVMTLILIILKLTGVSESLTGPSYNPQEVPTITIVNNIGYEVREVYISPSEHDHYGSNWLVSDQVLNDTENATFTLFEPLGTYRLYDIRLVDLDGDTYTRFRVDIARNRQIIFTFSNIDYALRSIP